MAEAEVLVVPKDGFLNNNDHLHLGYDMGLGFGERNNILENIIEHAYWKNSDKVEKATSLMQIMICSTFIVAGKVDQYNIFFYRDNGLCTCVLKYHVLNEGKVACPLFHSYLLNQPKVTGIADFCEHIEFAPTNYLSQGDRKHFGLLQFIPTNEGWIPRKEEYLLLDHKEVLNNTGIKIDRWSEIICEFLKTNIKKVV